MTLSSYYIEFLTTGDESQTVYQLENQFFLSGNLLSRKQLQIWETINHQTLSKKETIFHSCVTFV